jgi:hypothetical protein
MAMVNKIWYTGGSQNIEKDNKTQQSINWQGLYVLVKEVVVPKAFEHLRRIGHSCRPAGPLLRTDIAIWGFLFY